MQHKNVATDNVFASFLCLAISQLASQTRQHKWGLNWVITETEVCEYVGSSHTVMCCAVTKEMKHTFLLGGVPGTMPSSSSISSSLSLVLSCLWDEIVFMTLLWNCWLLGLPLPRDGYKTRHHYCKYKKVLQDQKISADNFNKLALKGTGLSDHYKSTSLLNHDINYNIDWERIIHLIQIYFSFFYLFFSVSFSHKMSDYKSHV